MSSPPDLHSQLRELTATMANLPLYVALRTTERPERLTPELLLEHLQWMVRQEAAGRIFASGPFEEDGRPRGADGGMTIVRAADEPAARCLLDDDPFVRDGAVNYVLRRWVLMEGTLDVLVHLSGRRVTLA